MPLNREDLRKTRENSLNSSAVLYSRPREVRIDYAPVKKERDTRRDSRTSHVSHASSMLQGYGCRCPPALKHFIKYMWILVLLVYIFVMPYLISMLHKKVTYCDEKLKNLEKKWSKHSHSKAVTTRQAKQEKIRETKEPITMDHHKYAKASEERKELRHRLDSLYKR